MPFKIILGMITLIKNDILSKTFSTSETTSFSEAIFFLQTTEHQTYM